MTKVPRIVKANCIRKWRQAVHLVRKLGMNKADGMVSRAYQSWWDNIGSHACAMCEHMMDQPYSRSICEGCQLQNEHGQCHEAWEEMRRAFIGEYGNGACAVFERCAFDMYYAVAELKTTKKRRAPCQPTP